MRAASTQGPEPQTKKGPVFKRRDVTHGTGQIPARLIILEFPWHGQSRQDSPLPSPIPAGRAALLGDSCHISARAKGPIYLCRVKVCVQVYRLTFWSESTEGKGVIWIYCGVTERRIQPIGCMALRGLQTKGAKELSITNVARFSIGGSHQGANAFTLIYTS